jgi:uncharacterized OB-fold protein
MTDMAEIPTPVADRDSAPFWEAAGRGELRVQVCSACGRGVFPPLPGACPACPGSLAWRTVDPAATVYSWIGVEHAIHDWEAALVPFSVVLAQLDELPDVRIPCFSPNPADRHSLGAPGVVAFGPRARPEFR